MIKDKRQPHKKRKRKKRKRQKRFPTDFIFFLLMLLLIPTPIGNRDDITVRALTHLRQAQIILAEDTRTCKSLLSMYEIPSQDKKIIPYTSYSDDSMLIPLVKQAASEDIVVVSEAGTPGLSDPGKSLIRLCIDHKTPYSVLPGANALVPAIVSAGFPTNTFVFLGFAPHKKGRETFFASLAGYDMAVFFYESVHRIGKMLEQMKKGGLTGTVHLSREISKKFEQVWTGSLDDARDARADEVIVHKGEFVVGWYNGDVEKIS